MALEEWEVDGFVLTDGLVLDVSMRDGLNQVPAARGSGQAVAGRHGELPGGRLKYGPGSFVLNMWLGGSTVAETEALYDDLLRAMGQVHRLHRFTRTLADGSRRTCRGRVNQSLQPTHHGQIIMQVAPEVYVPDAFWTDVTATQDATAAGSPLPQDLLLASKARATAPMGDLVYTIVGPITNPLVQVTSDPEVIDSFTYTGTVPAGAQLVVDAGTWNVQGVGFAPNLTLLSWTGDRYLEVPPGMVDLTPSVRLSGGGATATTRLVVAGVASYLC